MLARASSTSNSSSVGGTTAGGGSSSSGSGPTRQQSQNSIFDSFTSSAKEFIAKERQPSQEGSFLSQVDKVRIGYDS